MEESVLEGKDPFDWSIDEVVAYLCYASFESWARSTIPPPRPKPELLENALRENDVTGNVLLTEINKQVLSEDFGVKSLGQRATVIHAVQHLQGLSQKYKEHVGQLGLVDIKPEQYPPIPSPSLFGHFRHGSHFPIGSRSSVHLYDQSLLPPSTPAPPPIRDDVVMPMHVDDAETVPTQPSVDNNIQGDAAPNDIAQPSTGPQPKPKKTKSASKKRSNEHMVVDKAGKKRRKLNLEAVSTQPIKRSRRKRYYDRRRRTVADIFYQDIVANEGEGEAESEDDEFCITGLASRSTGYQHFVNKKMQYYLQQRPQYLKDKEGKVALAKFPYRFTPSTREEPQYFSLFSKNGKKVNVTKECVSDWPELDLEDEKSHYLLSKYPPKNDDDNALPVYGDSASEEDYDSETWNEIEQENARTEIDNSNGPKVLSAEEVDAAIDSCIADFVREWQEKKRPVEQKKAAKIWLRAETRRTRQADIGVAYGRIAHMDHRIKEMRKAIKATPWTKPKDIQLQCQAMEQTIFEREFRKWTIDVLELTKCPPKINEPVTPRPKPPRRVYLSQDEESLGSDTSVDTDDFVVPDDQPAIRVHESTPVPAPIAEDSNDEDRVVDGKKKRELKRASAKSERGTPKMPSPYKLKTQVPATAEFVDLTISDDEEMQSTQEPKKATFDVRTPPLNPSDANHRRTLSSSQFSLDDVEGSTTSSVTSKASINVADLDFARVLRMSTPELQSHRTYLLVRFVYRLGSKDREGLINLLDTKSFTEVKDAVFCALRALKKRSHQVAHFDDRTAHLLLRIAMMYVAWIVRKKRLSQSEDVDKEIDYAIRKKKIRRFLPLLSETLQAYPSQHIKKEKGKRAPAEGTPKKVTEDKPTVNKPTDENPVPEEQEIAKPSVEKQTDMGDSEGDFDDDEALPDAARTPHRKRKRAVKQSQEAIDTQKRAQHRVQLQEEQQQRLLEKFERAGAGSGTIKRHVVSFDEPVIYLDPHIGRRVKPHQLQGVQFMWRELIKDEKRQGCLLAHTMGLGKTMQV